MRCAGVAVKLSRTFTTEFDGGRSVGHRENQNPVVRLISEDGQIRELVDGDAKLSRAAQAVGPARSKRVSDGVDDRNGLAREVGCNDSAGLRIQRQRSRVDT